MIPRLHALVAVTFSSVAVAIDPQYAKNITVYHVNELIFPPIPINMDTGDLHGDMYFDVRGISAPLECAADPTSRDCVNPEVTGSNLTVNKLVLEVDSRFGAYGRCNVCVNHTDHHGDNNCTNGQYICNCASSFNGPPVACNASVGMENVSKHGSYGCDSNSPKWDCWRSNTALKTGGLWFSTTSKGYNITWRVVQVVKRVTKECSDNSIFSAVENHNQDCFSACGPNRNISSACWIECFYNTVLGPNGGTQSGNLTGSLPLTVLENAWDAPFLSNDPTQGGCLPIQ